MGKMSVALLILRLIGPNIVWRKWMLYVAMASVFLINALGCILALVQCGPPRALWATDMSSNCWDPRIQSDYPISFSIMAPNVGSIYATARSSTEAQQVGMSSLMYFLPRYLLHSSGPFK